MSLGATLGASFLITLVRPATWALALAAFLVRGGIVIVLAPIVVIPSAVGLANVIAPWLTSFLFGGVSIELLVLGGALGVGGLIWLLGGGLLAAAAEAVMTAEVAGDEDLAASDQAAASIEPATGPGRAWRILVARLLAHLPTLLALAWGGARVVSLTYRELTVPSDVLAPLVVRVVRGAPEAIAVILVAWLVGEAVGSLAARYVVLRGDGPLRAVGGGLGRLVRHPVRVTVLAIVPLAGLLGVLVPSAAAAGAAWDAVRSALATDTPPPVTLLGLLMLVGLWIGGLGLAAVIGAWRAAVWTVDVVGTFGVTRPVRAGDWQADDPSGTLTDLRPRGVDPEPR